MNAATTHSLRMYLDTQWNLVGAIPMLSKVVTPASPAATSAEPDWMRRLQEGHSEALDELMRIYSGPLFAFLCRRVRPREAAEDLFQETWVRVVERCHTFRANAAVKSWLYRVALNVVTDHYRQEKALRRGGDVQHVPLEGDALNASSSAPDAHTQAVVSQERDALHMTVEALPEAFREVVRLRYFEELSTAEVADVLGCAEGTVKSRLSRALALLQAELAKLEAVR